MTEDTKAPAIPLMPYILKAFYEWLIANELTPHIIVNASHQEVKVPNQYIQNGKVVLNIAPFATRDLVFNNKHIEFDAYFDGVVHHLHIPVYSVSAIYAKENGAGTVFTDEELKSVQESLQKGTVGQVKIVGKKTATKKKTAATKTKKTTKPKLEIISGGKDS